MKMDAMENNRILFSEGFAIIKDLDKVDIATIRSLKDIKIPIRILVNNVPNQEKFDILNNEILTNNASMVTLILISKNKNWINLHDFQRLSLIQNVEIHNTSLDFSSIDGIQDFRHLKSLSLLYRYGKFIELELLSLCEKLESLTLDEPLTKQQHEQISHLKSVKKIKLNKLNSLYLTQVLSNVEHLIVYNLQDTSLHQRMPNLKKIRIYNSNKITEIDFLSFLYKLEWVYLYGLNNVNQLPVFSKMLELKEIVLQNMKRLNDASTLIMAKQLTGICIKSTSLMLNKLDWLAPENFPLLKNLIIELSTQRESHIIYERFIDMQIGKKLMLS